MPLYKSSVIIKELRIEKGLTQAQLCEGICTKDTLSRIERGLRRPDWFVFEKLMQKLGEDPHKYFFGIVNDEEYNALTLRNKIIKLLQDEEYDEALKKIEEFERSSQNYDPQFVYNTKAGIELMLHKNYQKSHELLLKAIKVTRPNFDENSIGQSVFTYEEILIINSIAVIHTHMENWNLAVEIFLTLKRCLDKNYFYNTEKAKTYAMLLYNISKCFTLLGEYEKCIEISEQGIQFCNQIHDSYYPPLFYYNKAFSIFSASGPVDAGKIELERAYRLLSIAGRFDELNTIKKGMLTRFQVNI